MKFFVKISFTLGNNPQLGLRMYVQRSTQTTMKQRSYYRRKLPHIQPKEGTFFVTYRLFGSIPKPVIKEFKEDFDLAISQLEKDCFEKNEKPYNHLPIEVQNKLHSIFQKKKIDLQKLFFKNIDDYLDQLLNPPYWLQQPEIAKLNQDALHFYDGKRYDLKSYCIMPNHIHALFTLLPDAPPLEKVMQNLKSYTARKGNVILDRVGQGKFWEEESYDHILRINEFERVVLYILNNPVKAKFVKDRKDWKWTYLKEDIKVHT